MTALLPPPSLNEPARGRGEAVDERAASSAAVRPPLDAWSRGLDATDPIAAKRCRDGIPELMVELI